MAPLPMYLLRSSGCRLFVKQKLWHNPWPLSLSRPTRAIASAYQTPSKAGKVRVNPIKVKMIDLVLQIFQRGF